MAQILIVDDDPNFSHLTKVALDQKGYETVVTHTFNKAVEAMTTCKPDLIIMDIMMPGVSGAEAVKRFRRNDDFSGIPVIFLTGLISGYEENTDNEINIDGMAYQTLGKPFEIDQLLEVVRKNLDGGTVD
jgi:DNA-binding response OmpR family regulator